MNNIKNDKTIVIIGANGMMGRYVTKYFKGQGWKNVVEHTRADLPINLETLALIGEDEDDNKLNHVVINCAGLIPQRDGIVPLDMILVNSVFPRVLQNLCERSGAKLIHITTDCVFSGKSGGYFEESPHDATSIYGKSKSLGEPANACVIRTSIIGEEINHKTGLLEWAKSNKNGKIEGYIDHIWNGVTCLQLAKYIEELIISDNLWKGVRHYMTCELQSLLNTLTLTPDPPFHRPIFLNKYKLLTLINEIYDLNIDIIPVKKGEQCRYLRTNYSLPNTPTIKEQIQEQKDFNIYE